jgi:hypothetical protein
MNTARKILFCGGVVLAAFGMLYGLHYALFVEHQTLDRMGASLTDAFTQAAQGRQTESDAALRTYASTKYAYVRQVDSHSHWIGLAMLLIVMGAIFDLVAFSDRVKLYIAIALVVGAAMFPLGVVLQTLNKGGTFASVLAILGSALTIVALAASAWGLTIRSAIVPKP